MAKQPDFINVVVDGSEACWKAVYGDGSAAWGILEKANSTENEIKLRARAAAGFPWWKPIPVFIRVLSHGQA